MRNLVLFFVIMLSVSVCTSAQTTDKKIKFSFNASAIVSFNKSTKFVGFMGPKLSTTLQIKKVKAEIGVNAMPGLLVKPTVQPILAVGSTLTLGKNSWKTKPIVGIIFVKTTINGKQEWQPMFAIGFTL